jgi:pimeloyl-ACP methyl ester carboxylesterase
MQVIIGSSIVLALAACGGQTSNAPVDMQATLPDVGRDATATSVDPTEDGAFAVTEAEAAIPGAATGRTLEATVFRPTGAGPFPLAIISPGFQMQRSQYASYGRHLATWGFVAILTDYAESGFNLNHTRLAEDVPAVIDWAVADVALAIDPTKIATAGHSLGGKISVYAATLDARIHAVVAWDPVDSGNPSVVPERIANTTAAIAVVGETTNATGGFMPCAPAAENFQTFYSAAQAPALELVVNGADHMDWVDDPSCTFCGFCASGTAVPELARRVTRRLDVAWLRRHLLDDAAMEPWLAQPPELAVGGVALQRK